MALAAGSRLGPYEIVSPLGAGGMGEVYRAKDTRVDRAVALKVLPEEFFESEERRQRFEREARMLASLNHPGIAALYSFEEIPSSSASRHILVMELVEGETLRERMKAGGLSARRTLEIGVQIARGLAAAHEKGIVHRDLKPENVMVSKGDRIKILDFGLAKISPRAGTGDNLTSAGTRSLLTEAGAVFGTAAYMSPEQVRGEPVDGRSDIFAFGTILYELLTGQNPFRAATSAETMTAILRHEPLALVEAAPGLGPALSSIVARCLEKQPEKRFQSGEDLAFALEGSSGTSRVAMVASTPVPRSRGRWALAVACAAGAVVGLSAALIPGARGRTAPSQIVRFTIQPPDGGSFFLQVESTTLAVSPDGSRLAYVALDSKGVRRVWLRSLSGLEARPLPGTDGALSVFWAPDGSALGFFDETRIRRLDLSGGAPVTICEDAGGGGKSGTWGREGDILFSRMGGEPIYRVPASGGGVAVALKPDASASWLRAAWPWFLPDGRRFLFCAKAADGTSSVMLAEPGRPPRVVVKAASVVQYSDPGYLLYVNEGVLLGQRFDARSGQVSGRPFSVAEHVGYFMSTGSASFATAAGGTLLFQPQEDTHRLAWFDHSGRETGTLGPPSKLLSVFVPPDGRPVLFDRARSDLGTFDVWSYDVERNVETRLTSAPNSEFAARWLPGGRSIVYSAVLGHSPSLVRRDLATGQEEAVLPASGFQDAADVSPDGRTLLYFERPDRGALALWALDLPGGGKPRRIVEDPSLVDEARFSLDGRYLAIVSAESGRPEVYVIPYPGPGERTRVSSGGGEIPRWSRDGRELHFLGADGRLMAATVRTTPALQLGEPRALFTLEGHSSWLSYDLSADGKRFLAVVPVVRADREPLSVFVNWPRAAEK